eukprot:911198-Rhodomonas_salina.2
MSLRGERRALITDVVDWAAGALQPRVTDEVEVEQPAAPPAREGESERARKIAGGPHRPSHAT